MPKPKDGIEILTDPLHFWGWLLSAVIITTALAFTMHLIGKHCIHTPFWVVLVAFTVILIFVIIVDVIKHLVKLQ